MHDSGLVAIKPKKRGERFRSVLIVVGNKNPSAKGGAWEIKVLLLLIGMERMGTSAIRSPGRPATLTAVRPTSSGNCCAGAWEASY